MGQERDAPSGWALPASVAVVAAVVIGGPLVFYGLHLTHRPVVHPAGQAGAQAPSGPGADQGPGSVLSPFPGIPTPSGSTAPASPGPSASASTSASPHPSATGAQPPQQQPPAQQPAQPPAHAGTDVHVAFNSNGVAYTVSVRIFNNTSTAVNGWSLSFATNPGSILAQNNVVVRDGGPGTVLLTNDFNDSLISAGGSVTFYYSLSGQPLTNLSRCTFNTASCTIEVIKVLNS
jgi:hypothetical protein